MKTDEDLHERGPKTERGDPGVPQGDEPATEWRLYGAEELGADGYPAIWHERLKHEVRENAEHRCVRCLHPYERGAGKWSPCDERCLHGGPFRLDHDGPSTGDLVGALAGPTVAAGFGVDAEWRILTVHHLDGDKANCRWWNLAALCQRCHLEIQGRVKMERVWPWEHSEWFKRYVAGYYAWTDLGEDLTPAEVEERLGELLALELQAPTQTEPEGAESIETEDRSPVRGVRET